MKTMRIYTLLALLMMFGAKASAQEPEWSWRTSLAEADTAFFRADEPYELSDGTVLLSGRTVYKDDCGLYKYYFPHPALQSLSSEGTELYHRQYAKEGYFGTMPHVLESGSGEVFLFITYSQRSRVQNPARLLVRCSFSLPTAPTMTLAPQIISRTLSQLPTTASSACTNSMTTFR